MLLSALHAIEEIEKKIMKAFARFWFSLVKSSN